MAGKKYYAVKTGRETGIFESWEECRASVEGFAGAVYKSFKELEEAKRYLDNPPVKAGEPDEEKSMVRKTAEFDEEKSMVRKTAELDEEKSMRRKTGEQQNIKENTTAEISQVTKNALTEEQEKERNKMAEPQDRPKQGRLLAYVDGSYDDSLKKYAFGCVFILPEGRIYTQYGNGDKEQALQHRNVTGEMLGAMYAVRTAMVSGFTEVELRYDYEGIEKWVTGQWRFRTELTGKYTKAMREWGKNIKICFTKVAAHSNVYYNEMADKMAKTGLREGNGTPAVKNLYEAEMLL